MKKLLFLAAIAAPLLAFGQNHVERNFLSPVVSIVVSNKVSWTNLNTVNLVTLTNILNLIYTNNTGTQVVITNANVGDTTAMAVDVPLWSDRNGNIPLWFPGYTNGVYDVPLSGAEVSIHLSRCGSGVSTTAVVFIFSPLWDGVHETTASGDLWTVGVTPAASSTVCINTNVPLYLWPGAKALRLRSITSSRTAASGDVAVDSVTLNGFVP